ncbi:Dynein heavy chain 6, axonemal [Varanus komodoensis]|nr:Dynein heavy chain 6, axonemal [Varanus komodoensis]
MDKKTRLKHELLVSRLQLGPEKTELPHMVKGKFIKPKQASSTKEEEHPPLFPAEIPSELRTAVYKADAARKHKVKAKEGKMGFEYVLSRIHKERAKPITDHHAERADWDRRLEYSNLKDMAGEKIPIIPSHEELSDTVGVSTVTSAEEPIIDDVIVHILRLRDKLGWKTSVPPWGHLAKSADLATFQKPTLLTTPSPKDDGEYVYCLIRSRNDPKADYDPYDLQVVSTHVAKQSKEYWTITASYVSKFTSVSGKQQMEIIPVMEWLYERQLYYALRCIDICTDFRKKKYFINWRNNVKRSKVKRSKMVMYEQLFFADEILQKCLLYMQGLCVDISNPERHISSEDKAIHFIKIDTSYTYTLEEFCEKQFQQSQQALAQIQTFKDKVIKVIRSAFLRVAEMKGAEWLFQHLSDDVTEKPKHFEIAGWRHVMERFSRFLQLVDRIFQELLRKLVHNALNRLMEIFKGSSNLTVLKVKTNEELIRSYRNTIERANSLLTSENRCLWIFQSNHFQEFQEPVCRSKEPEIQHEIITVSDIDKILEEVKNQLKGEEEYSPIFEVNICLRIPYEKDYRRKYYQGSDDYIQETPLNSLKEILEHDENLKTSSQCNTENKCEEQSENTQESNVLSSENKDQESICEFDYEPLVYKSSPEFFTDTYLNPNKREFSIQLQGILDGLENTIDQIIPFSQEAQLSIFVDQSLHKIMQPYEAYIDSEPKQGLAKWPNCDLILGTDPDYQSKILTLLALQSCSLTQVESYSRNFMEYCNMVDKAKHITDRISALRREMSTHEFRNILEHYTADTMETVSMIIERRISMCKVKSLNFQTDCLPYFEALLNVIHSHFYAAIDAKNQHLVEVTRTAVAKLSKELVTVDGFIEHLLYLSEISSQLPDIKMQFECLSELYSIAKDYDIFLPLQQLALYQTVVRTLQNLQSAVLICEKTKDDYIIKFNEGLGEYVDNLQAEMREYKNKVRNPVLLLSETLPKTAKEMIESLIEEAAVISEKIVKYANYQTVFDNSISDMKSLSLEKLSHSGQSGDSQRVNAELSEIESELALRKLLWDSQEESSKLFFRWKHTIFWNLDVDLIQTDVNRFMQIVHILEKGKCLPENTILPALKKSLMDFKEFLPLIIALRNPCLQARHWEIIQNIVGGSISWDKRFTLDKILELDISQCRKEINEVSITATNETTLEVMLKKIIALWCKTNFHLSPYHTESSSTLIISSAEDITALLEDSQVTISTIKGSCYVGPIKSLVDAWDRKLNLFSCTLEEWLTCQRNWIYLEPIFHAPEIKRQLPGEANLFSQVDNKWKEIMKRTEENPNALKATTTPGVFEMLQSNNAHLEKIQKALEDYLEVKRMLFPRFYFLSNAELLDVLAESKNPDTVQPHLAKCFANIRKLYIRPQEQRPPVILMIRSAEGEILLVPKPVKPVSTGDPCGEQNNSMPYLSMKNRSIRIRGPVEQWLGSVENTMYDMVRRFITVGVAEWHLMEFKEWFFTHPGQVVLLVSQIMFTEECETDLRCSNPKKEMIAGRDDLISLLEQLAEIASDILPYHKQTTLEALVILFIHCRDVLTTMIDHEIYNVEHFEWTRQLRYEWHELSPCKVIQGYASFEYGYEYLGCSPRLVITPLTDRCWLTVTGALQLNLGGCLAGPAGTGKTETVKDLSKALGKLCLSFNCSEGLDDKVMGKLFCGLVQSGAWCCFDEFNRIDIEVLSAIASQIQAIKAAKDSQTVSYKGRVELPDNLKSLFRPVSMMVPDYELIAEIMLFSEGFKSARTLSGKIVNLYHLCSKQLSQQDHYDFGMRAIKTVLLRAGQKRQELKTHISQKITGITGKFGLGIQNEAGHRLVEFCQENTMVIANTLFQQPKRRLYTWTSPDCQHRNQIDYGLCSQRWRNSIQSVKTRPGADCGSDHELLVAKFRLKLKVGENTRPLRYDLNHIADEYTVEVTNRFKELDLIDRVPEELWTEVHNIVQEVATKTIPKKKKCKKAKWLSEEDLQIAKERREAKGKGERERYTQLNAEFQRIARRDKNAFLNEQCREIEENNRLGRTRDLFKKIGDVKGTFHAKMGMIKDQNGRDLTEAEEIKKRWQDYTEELYKKELNVPDNHDGVVTDLEPDILECEV